MSLRLRLFLAVTLVIVVHTGLRIVLLAQNARDSARVAQQVQGEWVGKSLANTLTNPLVTNDLATVQSTVELLFSEKAFLKLAVLDDRGRTIIDLRPRAGKIETKSPAWFTAFLDIAAEPSFQTIDIGGVAYGKIEIIISSDSIVEQVWREAQTVAWVAIVEVTLLSLLLWALMEAGLRPLQRLSMTVQRIGAGDFGAHMAHTGSREFRELIFVVNDMSQKLQALYKERKHAEENILKLNQDLEHRVNLRTSELAAANEELAYQALHDFLTDIPNRTLLSDRLQQAILAAKRENQSVALMMMDLDRFKEINDTMGHHSGDLVLQAVASRLRSTLRQSDTAARLGGDEFAVVLPGIHDKETAVLLAQKILQAVQAPLILEGRSIDIGMSLGIALYPDQGEDAGMLMQRADMAMYAAKRSKSGYAFYDAEADRYSLDRLALKGELRHAISHDELVLYYQPKIDFSSDRISGVEALVRWQHPKHGLMLPDDFIPLAEATGLIKPLTAWVLHQALRQCAEWHCRGLSVTMAVNISATSLLDLQLPEIVAQALKETGTVPAWLELEITETAVMKEPALAIDAINKLNNMGIRLAIDDFGTGYSSMAYLQKLLVTQIKIDKSFVMQMNSNENDAIIVRSLIGLGHSLGLMVVAEGVESKEVWDQLKALGCDYAQGYCMGRPIPQEKMWDWLAQSPWGLNPEDHSGPK